MNSDDRLQAIARMLGENPADATSLAELGTSIGARSRTLSRLFRDELGMTFYEWRTQLRICHALVLLADGHDTTQTAYPCGWANASSFIAAFTNIVGATPVATEPVARSALAGPNQFSIWMGNSPDPIAPVDGSSL